MAYFPIVERELRVAARRRSTYFLRMVAATLAALLSFWFFLSQDVGWQQSGEPLFLIIVWMTFFAALATGMFTTADCLSSERRQGTLGLLFLTNVRAYQVVLGKLVATSLNAAYGLVAVVPLLALPVLMGGVTLGDVISAAGILGIFLYVSLCTGMIVSALCDTEMESVLGTLLAMIGLCVLPELLGALADALFPWSGLNNMVRLLSPVGLLVAYFDPQHGPPVYQMVSALLMLGGLGTGALMLSGLLVQRSFRSHGARSAGIWQKLAGWFRSRRQLPVTKETFRAGASERLRGHRNELLDDNPLTWLVNREPVRDKYVWGILGLFACIWCLGFIFAPRLWLQWETTAFFAIFLNGSLKLLLAAEAPRQLAEDRKSGSLELILSTPLSEREILSGYSLALFRQFGKPIAVVVAVEIALLCLGQPSSKGARYHGVVIVASILVLISDAITLGAVGIWHGLRMQLAGRAAWKGIFWTLIVPWLVAFPIVAFWTSKVRVAHVYQGFTYHGYRSRFDAPSTETLWILWILAVLAYNHFLTVRARTNLDESFRKLASESSSGNA